MRINTLLLISLLSLLGTEIQAEIVVTTSPQPYEIWHKILDPGKLDGKIRGFRREKVWQDEDGVWKSENRMFVYQDLWVSEVLIDLKEWTSYQNGVITSFKVESFVDVPVLGMRENWVKGIRVGDNYQIEVYTYKTGEVTQSIWPVAKFDEIWALNQRYIPVRRDIAIGATKRVNFFKPLTDDMEPVEIKALKKETTQFNGEEVDVVLMQNRFKKSTWTYWRTADNKVARMDYKRGTLLATSKNDLIKNMNEKIKERSGFK